MRSHPDGLRLDEPLKALESRGFHASFRAQPDAQVQCMQCLAVRPASEMQVLARARIEETAGTDRPAEESLAVGLRCPACRVLGTVVLAYGAQARGADVEVLEHLMRVPPAA